MELPSRPEKCDNNCLTGAKQVWSWHITKLWGPAKWTYYDLYVILDIFSRYAVGWMLASRESAQLAGRLIRETIENQGLAQDQLVMHSDRGPSMKSHGVAQLLATLGVTKSHSRPTHVRSGMLHVIALAQYATASTRSWAANSLNSRIRLQAEVDRLRQQVALNREEIRIKDARMASIAPLRRPHLVTSCVLGMLLTATSANGAEQTSRTVSVSGQGKVTAPPAPMDIYGSLRPRTNHATAICDELISLMRGVPADIMAMRSSSRRICKTFSTPSCPKAAKPQR